MPKLAGQTPSPIATPPQVRQESIRRAILTFFRDLEASSKSAVCLKCGSASDLRRLTASLALTGTGETWEISLPVCESCIRQDGISSAQKQDEFAPPPQIPGVKCLECDTERNRAALASEMKAIHVANMQYWKHGAVAGSEERSQYQGRQERLEEIRALSGTSSQREGRGRADRALLKELLQ